MSVEWPKSIYSCDNKTPMIWTDEPTQITHVIMAPDAQIHKNLYKHVPHKDRPPLIVARRNARERRRVQAVNNAFLRLRKIVPLGNNRGKRISKVKTLQTAIDYICGLQALLKQTDMYDLDIISSYHYDFDNEF